MTALTVARRLTLPVLYLTAALALVWTARLAMGQVHGAASWELLPLLLALGLLALHVSAHTVTWALLLRAVRPHQRPSWWLVVRSFALGWLIRYVPGVPAGTVGKFAACRDGGYRASETSAVLIYEMTLQHCVCFLVPAALLSCWFGAAWIPVGLLAAVLVVVVSLGVLHPAVAARVAVLLQRVRPRLFADLQPPPLRLLVLPLVTCALASLLAALAFHLVAIAITPLGPTDVGRTMFAFSLAGALGFVVPLLPSGAGVREGVLVALLGPVLGHAEALSLALVARGVAVLFDSSLGFALGAVYVGGLLRAARLPSIATASKNRA